jgi:hypothetical protein
LPSLLFLTDLTALGRKIGPANAQALADAILESGQQVVDVEMAGAAPRAISNAARPYMSNVRGVVLLGDMDVVPGERLDVLGPEMRAALSDPAGDPDHFIVWSDEVYGCIDDDDIPELPVSRIPDGGSATTMAAALRAGRPASHQRFGIRNVARPFADVIFTPVANGAKLKVSRPVRHTDVSAAQLNAEILYFMLHGSDEDTRRFWGESSGETYLEAINVGQVPATFSGVVFAGCCWGALTADRKALDVPTGGTVSGRTAKDSMAVAFVSAGARAFVGCTGVHYSPAGSSIKSAGAPMHRAFLDRLAKGDPPALALFEAKRRCIAALPVTGSPEEVAVGLKIIRQFTCLGLGW